MHTRANGEEEEERAEQEGYRWIRNDAEKEVTGVSEQRLTCENPLESARTCPMHELSFKSFNLGGKKDIS